MKNKSYFSLTVWIVFLIAIGAILGLLTKPEINGWYSTLNQSPLTPKNNVFPVAWTILYSIIAICGWMIWRESSSLRLQFIKFLYATQLILNWIWTPFFFHYHLTGFSLLILSAMDIAVGMIVYFSYLKIKTVSLLMIPYLLWILFATYLNFYVWKYN